MDIKSLKIKTKTNYNWDDMVYIYDFDVNLVKIIKTESRIGVNIYFIGYVPEPENDDNSINPLYFVVNRLFGHIEKIEGSMFLIYYGNLLKIKLLPIVRLILRLIK